MKTVLFLILFVTFLVSNPDSDLRIVGSICAFLFFIKVIFEVPDNDPNP